MVGLKSGTLGRRTAQFWYVVPTYCGAFSSTLLASAERILGKSPGVWKGTDAESTRKRASGSPIAAMAMSFGSPVTARPPISRRLCSAMYIMLRCSRSLADGEIGLSSSIPSRRSRASTAASENRSSADSPCWIGSTGFSVLALVRVTCSRKSGTEVPAETAKSIALASTDSKSPRAWISSIRLRSSTIASSRSFCWRALSASTGAAGVPVASAPSAADLAAAGFAAGGLASRSARICSTSSGCCFWPAAYQARKAAAAALASSSPSISFSLINACIIRGSMARTSVSRGEREAAPAGGFSLPANSAMVSSNVPIESARPAATALWAISTFPWP